MVSDLDVIIGRDARPLPFRIAIGRRRQRIERRTLDRLQELVAALADAAHDLVVDGHYAVTDRGVQLGQREEAAMAQLRQHEALDDLDRDLDLRLIARLHHAGREYNAAVVVGEVPVRPVDAGLVARWPREASLQI